MKIVAYQDRGQTLIGRVGADGSVVEIAEVGAFWSDPATFLAADAKGSARPLAALQQKPAIPQTARVICIGLNYRLHAQETGSPIPERPMVFGRWWNTLATDGQPAPVVDDKFDWEGELGVVIGRRMFRVSAEQGLAGVFGYAAFNDLSARTYQMHTSQFTIGKNTEASGPMSAIVTADEVGDPRDGLRLSTKVNGQTVQDSTTSDMIFSVGEIISYLSEIMILNPGDLIVTGTPSGVGIAQGWFLKPGDEVEVEIEKVGTVRTPLIAAPAALG